MDVALLILVALVFMAMVIAFWKGRWQLLISGFKQTGRTFKSMWLRLLLGITFGGLIQVLIPTTLLMEWLGPASGLKGILIGSYVGLIMVGGPYVQLPIIASLYQAGAGVGPVIALLTAGNLISLQWLLAWHIPFFGIRIALARYIVCLVVPPLVGLAGDAVFQVITAF